MISVKMSSLWGSATEKIAKGVNEATDNIIACYQSTKRTYKMYEDVFSDVHTICDFWTGHTYVGDNKKDVVKEAFQKFFEALMTLLLDMCQDEDNDVRKSAERLLYRGIVYRYLGHGSPSSDIINPIYDGIYVSWSKTKTNTYIESKLYGTMTRLTCEIKSPLYGIDLEALGCSLNQEREVVFPTLKDCVVDVEYIEEEYDEQT